MRCRRQGIDAIMVGGSKGAQRLKVGRSEEQDEQAGLQRHAGRAGAKMNIVEQAEADVEGEDRNGKGTKNSRTAEERKATRCTAMVRSLSSWEASAIVCSARAVAPSALIVCIPCR